MEKVSSLELVDKLDYSWQGYDWSYNFASKTQEEIVDSYRSPVFLSGVHDHVISLGRSLKSDLSEISGVPLIKTERGGKAMYHGPGQLTCYPILKISDYFSGPKDYICFLFCSLKEYFSLQYEVTLTDFDNGLWTVDSNRNPLKKVGFIGLRIKNGVSYHGFSLNYFSDLERFKLMNPCNISGDQVGNLFDEHFDLEKESKMLVSFISDKLNTAH